MTIIEVLVWIMVFVFAILAIVASIQYFYKTNTYAVEQSSAVASAERGVKNMVRAVRETTYSVNGAYPIASMSDHTLTLYADIDGDGRAERVRYFIEGTALKRGVVVASTDMQNPYVGTEEISVLSDNVRNIEQDVDTFEYYDTNNSRITNFNAVIDVRFVSINVVVNVDPNKLPNQLTLRSSAALRNLK